MTNYNIRYKDDHLAHAGKKGMKWGFNDGQKNGKRTAEMNEYESEQYINGLTQDQVGNMSWSEYKKYKKAIKKSGWNKGKKKELYSMGRDLRDYYRLKNFDKDMSRKNRRAKLEAKYAIGKAKTKDAINSSLKKIKKTIKNPVTTKTTRTYLDNSGYTETYNHRTKKKTVKNFKNNKTWKVKKIKPSK